MIKVERLKNKILIKGLEVINNVEELSEALWWEDIYIEDSFYIDTYQSKLFYFDLDYASWVQELSKMMQSLNDGQTVEIYEVDDYNFYKDFYPTNDTLIGDTIRLRTE